MVKNPPANAGDTSSIPRLGNPGKPLEKEKITTPVFLPEKYPGQMSLAGCSTWGCQRVGHDLATKQQQTRVQLFLMNYLI